MADESYKEFKAYWALSDELIGKASKEQLAETARILALQSAHYARKYGELPLPALFDLLKATQLDPGKIELLRDGTEALVGVLAVVVGGIDEDTDNPMQ
jgi:acetyl-CoA acetyltransferase